MLAYQKIIFFAKGYVPNWSERSFKNTVLSTYVIIDLKDEDIVRTFYGKEFQKTFKLKKSNTEKR